jgi:hypothetical protein
MKILQNPIRATILLGLICGLSFSPLCLALSTLVSGPNAVCLSIWLFAAGYALFLSRWSGQKLSISVFPMLLLILAVFLVKSMPAFFLLTLMIIAWIRSGICYQKNKGARLVAEVLLCLLGGALVAVFTPASASAWALGAWMLFLLQALYFVMFGSESVTPADKYAFEVDPFERACRQAEEILSTAGNR